MIMPGHSEAAPFSWNVNSGEPWLLVGEDNVGKSTLIRLILGFTTPLAGSVTLFGETLSALKQAKLFQVLQRTSVLFELDGLINSWNVYDNIVLPLRYRGAIAAADRRLDQFVSDYQFPRDWLSESVTALSHEERRMVALARALITRPELLVVDGLTLDTSTEATWGAAFELLKQSLEQGCSLIAASRTEEQRLFKGFPVRIARLEAGRITNQHQRGSNVANMGSENAPGGAG